MSTPRNWASSDLACAVAWCHAEDCDAWGYNIVPAVRAHHPRAPRYPGSYRGRYASIYIRTFCFSASCASRIVASSAALSSAAYTEPACQRQLSCCLARASHGARAGRGPARDQMEASF